jgi:hypothetical protein
MGRRKNSRSFITEDLTTEHSILPYVSVTGRHEIGCEGVREGKRRREESV